MLLENLEKEFREIFTEQLSSDWMKQSETTMIIKTKLKKLFIDYTT